MLRRAAGVTAVLRVLEVWRNCNNDPWSRCERMVMKMSRGHSSRRDDESCGAISNLLIVRIPAPAELRYWCKFKCECEGGTQMGSSVAGRTKTVRSGIWVYWGEERWKTRLSDEGPGDCLERKSSIKVQRRRSNPRIFPVTRIGTLSVNVVGKDAEHDGYVITDYGGKPGDKRSGSEAEGSGSDDTFRRELDTTGIGQEGGGATTKTET